MNATDKPYSLPDEEFAYILNCNITADNCIVQRQGCKRLTGFPDGLNMVSLIPSPAQNYILCVADGVDESFPAGVYMIDANGYTVSMVAEITGDLGADSVRGVSFGGVTIFSNTFGRCFKTDGLTVTELTGMKTGLLWESFDSRVWNARDKLDSYYNNLYFSDIGDPYTWTATNFIVFDNKITALKASGNSLFVGTSEGLYKVTATGDSTIPYTKEKLASSGVHGNGITEISAGVICAALYDGRFLVFDNYAKSGSQLQDIGHPVRDYIKYVGKETINDEDEITGNNLCTSIDGDRVYFSYTPRNNNLLNRRTLAYHIKSGGWTIYDHSAYYKTHLNTPYGEYFTAGDYNQQPGVYRITDDYTDDGVYQSDGVYATTTIPCSLVTKIYGGETSEIFKNWRNIYIDMSPDSPMESAVTVAYNFSKVYNELNNFTSYDSNAILGEAVVGQFILGGASRQNQKIRIDRNSKTIQIKIDKSILWEL